MSAARTTLKDLYGEIAVLAPGAIGYAMEQLPKNVLVDLVMLDAIDEVIHRSIANRKTGYESDAERAAVIQEKIERVLKIRRDWGFDDQHTDLAASMANFNRNAAEKNRRDEANKAVRTPRPIVEPRTRLR